MSDQTNLNEIRDTEPPVTETPLETPPETPLETPPHHGFLEQFQNLSHSTFSTLKEIVEAGLTSAERTLLVKTGIKLFALSLHGAKEEDFSPEEKQEIEALILELESTLQIVK